MKREFLSTADVLTLHEVLVRRYGGCPEIRDMGAVESAVYRPQCGYYQDIVQEACGLLESLLINHPFVDGNKRTAFAACDVFLRINGCRIGASSSRLHELMLQWISLDTAQRFSHMEKDLRPLIRQE